MLWGTVVNALAIILGSILGLMLQLREDVHRTIMQGLGLVVMVIGIKMGIESENILITIASLVIGGFIGEIFKIEDKVTALGTLIGKNKSEQESGRIAQGFMTASLMYCIGAMAVIGALEGGLQGTHNTLYAKAMLDGVSAIFLSSTFGIGVIFSVIPVFLYQGLITIFAGFLQPLFNSGVIEALTATGGVLILGIGINILGIKKIVIGNFLPSLLVAILLALIFSS